jgi:hypothetical protein
MVGHGWQQAVAPGTRHRVDSSRTGCSPSSFRTGSHVFSSSPCSNVHSELREDVLGRIPFGSLCPNGFVLVWAQKGEISRVFQELCTRWGFMYVENVTWVLTHVNKSVVTLPSEFNRQSHLSLLIFRKQGVLHTSTQSCFGIDRTTMEKKWPCFLEYQGHFF